MATRRHFLQGSLATASFATVANALGGAPALASVLGPGTRRLHLEAALFEPARPHSAQFANAMRQHGLPTLEVNQDMTSTWLQVVRRWRKTPVAIAGLTSSIPLLLLEQSARDYGLRVAFRADHHISEQGVVEHSLEGPAEIARAFNIGLRQGRDYGACMALAFTQCPGSALGESARLQTASADSATGEAPRLYSWIIAPRHQLLKQGTVA